MAEKVKVSRELFEALKEAEDKMINGLIDVIEDVFNGHVYTRDKYKSINGISKRKLLLIYKHGYEIEETPEEKILAEYNKHNLCSNYEMGYRYGIEKTLMHLGIKIKGINK